MIVNELDLLFYISVPETPNITAAYAWLDTSQPHAPLVTLYVEWMVRAIFGLSIRLAVSLVFTKQNMSIISYIASP